jgi:hypothetical protein
MANEKVKQDKNLEEKLRKLFGNTKKSEEKKYSKPVEEKKVSAEDKSFEKKIPFEEKKLNGNNFHVERLTPTMISNITHERGIGVSENAPPVQQGLERNVANIPSPQPIANEQVKREEAYQSSKEKYDSVENVKINNRVVTSTQRLEAMDNALENRTAKGILPTQMPKNESSPREAYSIPEVGRVTVRKNNSAPWENNESTAFQPYKT